MHTHCINYDESIRAVAKRLISNNFSGTSLAGTRETDEFFSTGIVCDGEKASFSFSQLPDPDDTCDSGNLGAQMYTLDDCVVFIDTCDGDALYIAPPGTDMLDYLLLWDMGDMDASEFLAQFGYDDYVDEADDTDTDVRIWVQPNYYQGQCNAPIQPQQQHYGTDGQGTGRQLGQPQAEDRIAHLPEQRWPDLEPDEEQQDHHAELGEAHHIARLPHQVQQIRADQGAGDQIAQHRA